MQWLSRPLALAILIACGPQRAAPERPPPRPSDAAMRPADAAPADAAQPADAAPVAQLPPPPPPVDAGPRPDANMTCPKSLAAADGQGCDADGIGTCKYREGTCSCESFPDCSGTDGPDRPTYWKCRKPIPKIRPDGCPGKPPEGKCTKQGQKCGYEEAICCSAVYECRGTWQRTGVFCPM
jgi:hypothetical protein